MTTTFALLCNRCGLSHREAADFLEVRPDTVKSWSAGRNRAPEGAIAELRELYARIDAAGEEIAAEIERLKNQMGDAAPSVVEIGLSTDDAEAQSLGWPCVGAHAAALGIGAALTDVPFEIVPRGSTEATALAADAHDAKTPT